MKSALLLFLLLIATNFGIGQTGPGGVGTNDGTSSLKLWYRPDFGISTTGTSIDSWTNGAGVTAFDLTATGTNRPTLSSATVNGNDELSFDGNDFFQITGTMTTTNFMVDEASSFVVTERSATTANWVYATSPHQTDRFSCHISWSNGAVYFDVGGCCATTSRIQVSGLGGLGAYSYWSLDALNATGKQLYRNGALIQNRAGTQTYASHSTHTFRIGEVLNGNLTEIIIFRQKINLAQRLIVENYLSAKYNIAPAASDIYNEDDAANGNFDFDVAGIGQATDGTNNTDALGTGMVRILNATNLNNDEYFIWGHDNGIAQALEVLDVPVGVAARFERVWRVSEVSSSNTAVDVGAIDMRFDLNGLGSITVSDLRLLVDTDNDGVFSDETPIAGATDLGGDIYEFSGVTAITNDRRFTLGTINNNQTPLPIELIEFTAEPQDNKEVILKWKTATETENSYFTIQRSQNGTNWEALSNVAGSGNSTSNQSYSAIDTKPFTGLSYYRLKQTDFNGNFSYTEKRSVLIESQYRVDIYPNPAENEIYLSGEKSELSEISIFSVLGQDLTEQITQTTKGSTIKLDISNLSSGIFYINTKSTTTKVYKR